MSDKPAYEDPEQLARARYRGGEKHSYSEMAEELGCSTGTISLRMKKYEKELQKYGPSDFEDAGPLEKDEKTGPRLPFEIDLPKDWPPEQDVLDEMVAPGVAADNLVDEARWNCPYCLKDLRDILDEVYGVDIEDIIQENAS